MSVLKDKKILLGITGGIAAYKSAWLVRLLVKSGAEVKVVLTPAAKEFVTPLTLSTLSKNPVLSQFTDDDDENAVWNNHVELGLWADLMVIAPATANTMSKMRNGICDNLLLATYLSAKCPVYFAPAMDLDMYKHQSTIENLTVLQERGNVMIPAESGELASGLVGEGRMAEPESILSFVRQHIESGRPLSGKKVLVNAGPTYEPIDPVRFIGNHSSGKMGFEIAKRASALGAEVVLVSGPSSEQIDKYDIDLVKVTTADEMFRAVHSRFEECDIAILSAAVADYKPKNIADQKIKKAGETLQIELIKTKDILKSLGSIKKKDQFLVGFALETENELSNAQGKLELKNLDLIVLNSLNDEGAGFGASTNRVTFISRNGVIKAFEKKPKSEVASDIWNHILSENHA